MPKLILASRGSKLARIQASIVADLLRGHHTGLEVVVNEVSTSGDVDRRPFTAIGGKGLFVAEVEREVAEGRADAAVHSAKDLTSDLAPGCAIVCVPARADPADVVVGGEGDSGEERLASLQPGAVVGTSSMRRRALLAETRQDLEVVDLRGNLDTRLRKVAEKEIDGAVLAAAGLGRLRSSGTGAPLDLNWWVPAPAQGALAVEVLEERAELVDLFAPLRNPAATAEVLCERAFSAHLEGGCSVPLGCLARASADSLTATGYLGSPDGSMARRDRVSGPLREAEALGEQLADAILQGGGEDILEDVRAAELTTPSPP